MEIYLVVITTLLVLTQIVRLIQNAAQLNRQGEINRKNDKIMRVYEKLEQALDQYLGNEEMVDQPESIYATVQLPDPFTQEEYDKYEEKLMKQAQERMVGQGGIYSSVLMANVNEALTELKKRIVPDYLWTKEGKT